MDQKKPVFLWDNCLMGYIPALKWKYLYKNHPYTDKEARIKKNTNRNQPVAIVTIVALAPPKSLVNRLGKNKML